MKNTVNQGMITAFVAITMVGCDEGPTLPPQPEKIAASADDWGICEITVDDTHIFYTRRNSDVVQIDKKTGESKVIFSSEDSNPVAIRVEGDSVYLGTQRQILKTTRGGGMVETLAEDWLITDVELTADRIYYGDNDFSGEPKWIPKSGGTPTILPLNGGNPIHIEVGDQYLYFGGGRTVEKTLLDGGGQSAIVPAVDPLDYISDLETDETHMYFAANANRIGKVAKDGGPVIDLSLLRDSVGEASIALDAQHVYWATFYGQNAIWRVSKEGGDATTLYTLPRDARPCGIAVDDQYVYWGLEKEVGLYRGAKKQVQSF